MSRVAKKYELLQTLKNLKVFAKTNLSQIMVFNFGT